MSRSPAMLALCAALLIHTACRSGEQRVLGVVPKGASHIFWQSAHAGAIKAADEFGYKVEWSAPALEIDSGRQIEIVDAMINRHVSGIALAPVDKQALVAVVERAAAKGIPVAIFDSAIDTEKILSYVATDNIEAGRMAARRMGEILGGKGKVGIVGFMPGSASTMDREHGFQDEIRARFPQIDIVALQFGMADRAKAMAVTENILSAHPDLAGVFADNESSSDGAVQALKSRRASKVKLVAFDASEQLIGELRDGSIDSLVVQNPFRMGYESARAIARKLKGESPERKLDSGASLIRREDLEREETKQLLFPDIQKYLKGAN